MESLCAFETSDYGVSSTAPRPVAPHTVPCPSCATPVGKFTLLPVSTDYLDTALQKRKETIAKEKASLLKFAGTTASASNNNTPEIQAENHYLLVLRGHSSSMTGGDTSYQRTGRWTGPEVALTDYLVQAFDQGRLPIAPGVKLSDFLADLLLCKASRLSKKMKNSQLGTRSYTFRPPTTPLERGVLPQLLDRFVDSIASEPTRYELKFNIAKFWRLHLSNLALAMHQPPIIDVKPWMTGWEILEQKAHATEERIRSMRRQRLGLGDGGVDSVYVGSGGNTLKTASLGAATNNRTMSDTRDVAFSGNGFVAESNQIPINNYIEPDRSARNSLILPGMPLFSSTAETEPAIRNSIMLTTDIFDQVEDIAVESLLPEPVFPLPTRDMKKRRRTAEGPADDTDTFSQSTATQNTRYIRSHCGPFLTQLMHYVEGHNLPFQHADVWVPSYSTDQSTPSQDNLQLFHAGFVTRNDLDWIVAQNLERFGKESTQIKFLPGQGLPGRVYWKNEPEWECQLDSAPPEMFTRVDLAREYGICTGFCFPLSSSVIGTICVVLYSTEDLPRDQAIMDQCTTDLGRLGPEPKWKLVVEVKDNAPDFSERTAQAVFGHNDTEKRIATLLGDHMPLSDLSSTTAPTVAQKKREELLPHFLSLRLLLLRSPNRRTTKEKDHIQLLLDSFQGYDNGRRSDEDLAFLIVQDWVYIGSS